MIKKLIIVLILIISGSLFPKITYSQSIQNLKIKPVRDTVRIFYDLVSVREDDIFKIDLAVSDDYGETFGIVPKTVYGALGFGIKPRYNLKIDWMPLSDSLELVGDKYVFKLKGQLLGATRKVDFVKIKGGKFLMGCDKKFADTDEKHLHEVFLDDFMMSVHEITNFQFNEFLKEYGSKKVKDGEYKDEIMIYPQPKGLQKIEAINNGIKADYWTTAPGYEFFPVVGVTWYGANEYCKYYGYRLPSEAEWEYAARECGKDVLFGNGKSIADPQEINFNASPQEKQPYSIVGINRKSQIRVASFAPNKIGLFDMSGNVWEWCQDWYERNTYFHSSKYNPSGPWFGKYKVIRGGSWFNNALDTRTTDRSFYSPHRFNSDIGFRVVKEIENRE